MSRSDVYGWNCDLSDQMLAAALMPEKVIEMQIELGKKAVLREIMQNENLWLDLINDGQAYVEIKSKSYRYVVEPFDYEDEDGVVHHSDGWECTRLSVTGWVMEGVRGS